MKLSAASLLPTIFAIAIASQESAEAQTRQPTIKASPTITVCSQNGRETFFRFQTLRDKEGNPIQSDTDTWFKENGKPLAIGFQNAGTASQNNASIKYENGIFKYHTTIKNTESEVEKRAKLERLYRNGRSFCETAVLPYGLVRARTL